MSVSITAHLNFRGQAREALEYYQSVFGGELTVATYGDIQAVEEPEQTQQISFGRLDAPNGVHLMAYDVQPSKPYDAGHNAFYLTLHGEQGDEIQELWNQLAESARDILTPLAPAPFAPLYGMLTDHYGITWIIGAETEPAARQ